MEWDRGIAPIHASLACNLDPNILLTSLPLLEAGQVEAIEWSFDTLYRHQEIPVWFSELLNAFGREGRLVGHGVFFSLFSGKWSAAQAGWLRQLEQLCSEFTFDHITEHFGFMTGEHFHAGAPISIPFTPATLALGRDRLQRIQQACRCPVGLENLAFAYSLEEVKRHGEFLEQLVGPVNGFIILDLHNLYCQLHNFEVDFEDIIRLYPLDRVREIHLSGGSWEDSTARPEQKIRRDTHDDRVPEAVFQLLTAAIPLCSNLKYVVLEQLGSGLETDASKAGFREDFQRMRQMVHNGDRTNRGLPQNDFLPPHEIALGTPLEDVQLQLQQSRLSDILETAPDLQTAQSRLADSSLAGTAWRIEGWDPAMLETAMRIAQKWKRGWQQE